MEDEFKNDIERAEKLQDILVAYATGDASDIVGLYKPLRKHFIDNPVTSALLPDWIHKNREIGQFWHFIKNKFSHYSERREYIWNELAPLLDHTEKESENKTKTKISLTLKTFDSEGVHSAWSRATQRIQIDPEGAITAARTLVETVCKHILDILGIQYDSDRIELPELYKLTSSNLNLAPSQHTEETFKKILGGMTSVVTELGSLRNRLGDSHGKNKTSIRPAVRHAELAVNLAGSMALFLVETLNNKQGEKA